MATKRKAAAMAAAEDDEQVDPSDELVFIGLGGCQEVGRSCHILQYKGKTVMLDAGMHTGREGMSAMPYFDDFDLSTVDILLISHFHLDHAAALPYVLAKTDFKGRVFMTHPTKAIYKWLIQDSVRVSNTTSTSDQRTSLYTEADHISTLPQIETIDFYTTHTVSGVRITPYPAGHVLGAAMFLINIAGLNVFFTGDYSREQDRHLVAAEVPNVASVGKIDCLITESTFGISNAPPRTERETALLKSVSNILNRGGKVLMPVFALGRAQELLLILEDYWQRHLELQKFPIYYTGNTARKCMVVYQTYINAMNDNIKRIFRERMAEAEAAGNAKGVSAGPWDFRYVRSLRNLDRFDDVGGCVMLASPGMMQSGMSRILLERWAPDQRNGVIMTGYNVEGTMGRTILSEPEMIPAIMSGGNTGLGHAMGRRNKDDEAAVMIPRRCSVEEFQFAAHVTGVENVDFIQQVDAPHVILVHGERSQAARLRSRLLDLNSRRLASNPNAQQTKVYSPENGAEIKIPFRKDKVAKVVGKLAQIPPPSSAEADETRVISGVLVQNGFKLSLMAPEDLREYAGLTTTTILCRQHITLAAAGVELIKWALEGTFGSIEEVGHIKSEPNGHPVKVEADQRNGENGVKAEEEKEEEADEEIVAQPQRTFLIMGCVTLKWSGREKQIELEWEGNTMNDGIADAVMAVLMTVESSPAAVKYSSSISAHSHHGYKHEKNGVKALTNELTNLSPQDRFSRLCMFLEEQFGDNITPIEKPRMTNPPNRKVLPSGAEGVKKEEDEDEGADASNKEADLEQAEAAERARLAAAGIPVPGLEIRFDKHVAKLWLENLDVECANAVLRDRIKAVVERAVETIAPLWAVHDQQSKV
ncbi:endoribonuclease ysh1 [Cladophialophora psammophila CBS 110553]|uniref:Endoribonuclease YSH1 n=1 Tax=Cladophialophora psammophila CBS 110553 TaxID=1182543 RepID=W9X7C8_9EURO|nr:endoribonuclease ysh1 [Cladophialophora psammophila CBS 110553]EXJ66329.1 endoribonuclease ysh1 [Cladophialophora psammophila CBS 110553]